MFQIGSSPHGKYGLVAAGSHIFSWTVLRQIFIWNIFTKATLPFAAYYQAGQSALEFFEEGRKEVEEKFRSINRWMAAAFLLLFGRKSCVKTSTIHSTCGPKQWEIGILCLLAAMQILMLSSTSPWRRSTFGGVCPVSHSCCRRYLQLIFWNYTSLIAPPALYSFPALS